MLPNLYGHCFALAPLEVLIRLSALRPFLDARVALKTHAMFTLRRIVQRLRFPASYPEVDLREASTELLLSLGLDEYGEQEEEGKKRKAGGPVVHLFWRQFEEAVKEDVGPGMFRMGVRALEDAPEQHLAVVQAKREWRLRPSFDPQQVTTLHLPPIITVANAEGPDLREREEESWEDDPLFDAPWGPYVLMGLVVYEYGDRHVAAITRVRGTDDWRYLNNHTNDPGGDLRFPSLRDYPGEPNKKVIVALRDLKSKVRPSESPDSPISLELKRLYNILDRARTNRIQNCVLLSIYEHQDAAYFLHVPRAFLQLSRGVRFLLPPLPRPVLEPLDFWKKYAPPHLSWRGRAQVKCSLGHDLTVDVSQNYQVSYAHQPPTSRRFVWDPEATERCTVGRGTLRQCRGRWSAGAASSRVTLVPFSPPPFLAFFFRAELDELPPRGLSVEGVQYKLRSVLCTNHLRIVTLRSVVDEENMKPDAEAIIMALYRRITILGNGLIAPNSDSEGEVDEPRGEGGRRIPHPLDLDALEAEERAWE